MTADLVQRIDAALEHPSSLSVSEAALAERCDWDTPETMRRLVERAKEGRG